MPDTKVNKRELVAMMMINPNIPNRRRRIVVVAVYEVCLGLTASLPFRQLFFAEPLSLTTLFNRRPLLQHLKSTLCEMHPNWCGHFQSGAHALCKFLSVLFEGLVDGISAITGRTCLPYNL